MDANAAELIFRRRSIRRYTAEPLQDKDLQKLLEAGMAAPSAGAKDPWHFIVCRKPSTLSDIASQLPNGKMLAEANAGIVICGDISEAHSNEISYMLQDCSAAIENILIEATALGLGACWLGVHPREERISYLRKRFKLPENIIPISIVALGYPAEEKPSGTRFRQDKVHIEKW